MYHSSLMLTDTGGLLYLNLILILDLQNSDTCKTCETGEEHVAQYNTATEIRYGFETATKDRFHFNLIIHHWNSFVI